jgi:hypothetical protein
MDNKQRLNEKQNVEIDSFHQVKAKEITWNMLASPGPRLWQQC